MLLIWEGPTPCQPVFVGIMSHYANVPLVHNANKGGGKDAV